MLRQLLFCFSLLLLLMLSTVQAKGLPSDYFSQLPDVSSVKLSRDGKKLAAIIRINSGDIQGSAVEITTLATGEKKMMLFTDNTKYFLGRISWKDNRTLFVHTYYPSSRDTWVRGNHVRGNTRETRLLIIDTKTEEVHRPFSTAFLKNFRMLPISLDTIVDYLPDEPDHILMLLPTQNLGYPVVYKVNLKTKRTKIIQKSKKYIISWRTDPKHEIRVAHYYKDGVHETHIKNIDTGKWKRLWPYKEFSGDEVNFIGFVKNSSEVYIRAYHNGLLAIFKVDVNDPNLTRELIYSDPNYDVSGSLIYSSTTNKVIGVSAGKGTTFFDKKLNQLQLGIDKAMPNRKNYIHSMTNKMQSYLVYSTGHKESGTYYIGQRNPSSLKAIAYRYKNLPPKVLSNVKKYNYKARDGMEIEAWLTLPTGFSDKKIPTLVFPHGGPLARNSDAFDYRSQLLANKGYAVLQMNFRGSSGQGLEFRNAGLKNWGEEMQDDVEDGALQLIKDGIADPNRIGIIGMSYGGYAALMGVVKTPDFYKVSISVNGVSDVYDLVRTERDYWATYNVVDNMIGKLGGHLRDISPINHIDKIKTPILLIHGENDRQVKISHSRKMRDALKKGKRVVEYLELKNEDHFLSSDKERIAAFQAIDTFLDKHMPISNSN